MSKSYGGYLPLELRRGADYFSTLPAMRFNCANAAIDHVLETTVIRTIYVPYYMCPNICKNLNNKDINVIYYHVGDDLLPVDSFTENGSCIYIADYFGVMEKKTEELISRLKNHYVIADFCHAFYHEPILIDNVYYIYSARKFFGVPDGAYLVNSNIISDFENDTNNFSSDYSSYLITSLEYGTDYSYSEKKEADIRIQQNKGKMSLLARRILNSIDYEAVKIIRLQNARLYDEVLGGINHIHLDPGCSPYMYPFNVGTDIRASLVQEKVFTPTLWSQLLSDDYKGSVERKLTEETVFLPVDQRYDSNDIENIIRIVRRYI